MQGPVAGQEKRAVLFFLGVAEVLPSVLRDQQPVMARVARKRLRRRTLRMVWVPEAG
jgi:hypothetical protein